MALSSRMRLLPGGLVEIRLSAGYVTVIELDDLPKVVGFTWSAKVGSTHVRAVGYRHGAGRGHVPELMHRVLMGAAPGVEVDHRNGDTLDNRRSNLRFATSAQNKMNSKLRRDNRVGYKGVQFHAETGKYRARIRLQGRTHSLGLFATPEEAARAYDVAARERFSDFARPNFPSEGLH